MAEEEVLIEVEAAESVYGDDCVVLSRYPPHLHLLIKPRTADVSSQQFVEAVIGIRASSMYPDEPPEIMVVDSKGLDEQRKKHLITSIYDKACELSSSSMLVALCEEAVEKLTSMNRPDGDCPLCLSPLVAVGVTNNALHFMKLMSCFHCFHSECIIRWWNWLQSPKEVNQATSSGSRRHPQEIKTQSGIDKKVEDGVGICPVCRKVFHAKDIEHVLELVGAYSQLNLDECEEGTESDMLLHSDSEITRRLKFEATLKLQQEKDGLIEPKKTQVLMPGMFLPCPTTAPVIGEPATESKSNSGVSLSKASGSNRRSRNRYRGRNSTTQVVNRNRQWIVKEGGNAQ